MSTPHTSPIKKTHMLTRSAGGIFYFQRDPPVSPIQPKSHLSLRGELDMSHRITQYMEDNDRSPCPPDYAPLTTEGTEEIIAQLPEDNGLTVLSGSAADFADFFEEPLPVPVPAQTYAGQRSTLTATASTSGEGTASASVMSLNGQSASATASSVTGANATATVSVYEESPRRSTRLGNSDAKEPAQRSVVPVLRRKYQVLNAYPNAVLPTPFVDSEDLVVSVMLRGPSRKKPKWTSACAELAHVLDVIAPRAFGLSGGRARWGVTFAFDDQKYKKSILTLKQQALTYRSRDLTTDATLEWIAAYQNHALEQFYPNVKSAMLVLVDELKAHGFSTPFPGSAFSTCEFRDLTRAPMTTPQKQWQVRFCDIQALTVLGHWNGEMGGHLILHGEGRIVKVKPGDTFLLPAGAQAYTFVPVRAQVGERQYVFSQFFHASVARWVEKGGKTDKELEVKARHLRDKAALSRLHQWSRARESRADRTKKQFLKMDDVSIAM
ncbi:hypothetical protein MIND_00999200 [Mycena indigotica]|uniref:Uncharacterized protein n=1 Tax=Mycena indigotica TaxID=2126181 RepID=A0A8H6S9J1_9AGAR|nr:uncharacterized protein MIND_00999200 [Mycena indigotica]KAF7294626.1 hypothetical protein MIND_00999200 [Mycena indigotica]